MPQTSRRFVPKTHSRSTKNMNTETQLWAEQIEQASLEERARMEFGPFTVMPDGRLANLMEIIVRSPNPKAVPTPWPTGRAHGWLTVPIDDEWSLKLWCALGGEWVFQTPDPTQTRQVIVSDQLTASRKSQIAERLAQPLDLLNCGDAFAFCGMLFVLPEVSFEMNAFSYHPQGYEPLHVFVGYRGHTEPYPEVITPGIFRQDSNPTENVQTRYRCRARVAANVVKQLMYEAENIVLTNLQARGILQHYGIIGPTDILDLSYDVNFAKWFSLNIWDEHRRKYVPKPFSHHTDRDEAHDKCSVVYTVIVRDIAMNLDPKMMADLVRRSGVHQMPWPSTISSSDCLPETDLPRNISPLWSQRASRQSGFGLLGIGPYDDDAWGSVLGIVEHRFHPTFFPDGWNRIGGPQLFIDGSRYSWEDDTSSLAQHILPEDNEVISRIRSGVTHVFRRFGLA